MKTSILLLFSLLATLPLQAQPSAVVSQAPGIIPRPVSLNVPTDQPGYAVEKGVSVAAGPFRDDLKRILSGSGIKVSDAQKDDFVFEKDTSLAAEEYRLAVTPERITIRYATPQGAAWAITTLAQSLVRDVDGQACFPTMSVEDRPRFGWRALMIDSGRHMLPVKDVKKALDLMARYKFNTLHWHLTDDQGWRIEIPQYPRLTQIGSCRKQSPVTGNRKVQDGKPYRAFYTQDEIRDVVRYAKERHIMIVPEVEVPGHASAAIASYPEFGNKDIADYRPEVSDKWGVHPYIFAPSEETFRFLDDIFGEVAKLFPDSPYIHIGGDEAPKTQWKQSPLAQRVMKENGLKTEEELQSYFVKRVEKIVNKHGRKIIGWDEIQEGGLSPTATMMSWRSWNNWKWTEYAIEHGNDVIVASNSHLYFDFGQGDEKPWAPEYDPWGAEITLSKVYNYDPVPAGTKKEDEKHVLGVQANLWSEHIPNMPKWEYQVFPRALALSEIAWTPLDRKDEADFNERVKRELPYLDRHRVNYRTDSGAPAIPTSVIVREPLQEER